MAERIPRLEPNNWLASLGEAFRRAELAHALIGAHAVIAWSLPRSTADYDFVVAAQKDPISRLQTSQQ